MRALLLFAVGLLAATPDFATAQIKLPSKADPNAKEVRYFTSIDGLMNGDADVILKETRQGRAITGATLDVCYPADKTSGRKDRFVVNLTVNGQTLSGTTQSLGDKSPVTVKLTQKPDGDTFDFRGQISVGQNVTEVTSSSNSDISESEFQDSQSSDDGIQPTPKDFTDVSPESIGVRVKLDAALDFVKGLRGQDVEVTLSSLNVTCDALRLGYQTITIAAAPERAAALVAKFKSAPGVLAAGWTTGMVEMDRTIRIAAADWRDGDKLNRDRLVGAISDILAKTLSAKPTSSSWNTTTGKMKLTFKRPSPLFPALGLTDMIDVAGLVAPDKPGSSDHLLVWIGTPVTTTLDESAGAKLNLSDQSSGDEEAEDRDQTGSIEALARELKGQRWEADKSAWK
jgi:hypothetical protein